MVDNVILDSQKSTHTQIKAERMNESKSNCKYNATNRSIFIRLVATISNCDQNGQKRNVLLPLFEVVL